MARGAAVATLYAPCRADGHSDTRRTLASRPAQLVHARRAQASRISTARPRGANVFRAGNRCARVSAQRYRHKELARLSAWSLAAAPGFTPDPAQVLREFSRLTRGDAIHQHRPPRRTQRRAIGAAHGSD